MKKTTILLSVLVLSLVLVSCGSKSGVKIGSQTAPSGGYILYDCDADNDKGNPDGLRSEDCGWRYIEVAANDLLGMFEISDKTTVSTSTSIGKARENTELLASNATVSADAAVGCLNYKVEKDGKVYDDWYFPTRDEVQLMYSVLYKKSGGHFMQHSYWSSSVADSTKAYSINFSNGNYTVESRGFGYEVRPVRYYL